MADLHESPESRISPSPEYSVPAFDSLHLDCLLLIFQHLPLLDLLRLRHQSRSLNDVVCQFLRTCRKLELHLDVDRTGDDLERLTERYKGIETSDCQRVIPEFEPINTSDIIHVKLFRNQPHFRLENLTHVKSAEGLTDRKVDSLIHFLTTYMHNLTELALLIAHGNYFRSVSRLITPLRKLKVFSIDVTPSVDHPANYPSTEVVDAISGMPELESLYYFRGPYGRDMFCQEYGFAQYSEVQVYRGIVHPQRLGNGGDFLEGILPRLRVLHCHYSSFPVGWTFDKLQEISMKCETLETVTKNYFPEVKTLLVDHPFDFYSQLGDGRLSFVNVKVLKIVNWHIDSRSCFHISSASMRALNDLPNLEELHCLLVSLWDDRESRVVERNNTVVRLYSQFQNGPQTFLYKRRYFPDPARPITPEMMIEYANMCKKYFRRLQLMTNEHPPLVKQF